MRSSERERGPLFLVYKAWSKPLFQVRSFLFSLHKKAARIRVLRTKRFEFIWSKNLSCIFWLLLNFWLPYLSHANYTLVFLKILEAPTKKAQEFYLFITSLLRMSLSFLTSSLFPFHNLTFRPHSCWYSSLLYLLGNHATHHKTMQPRQEWKGPSQ